MLFSKRQALVDEFVTWCDDADAKLEGCKIDRGAFGVICFLDSKGVLLEKPNSSKVDSTSANTPVAEIADDMDQFIPDINGVVHVGVGDFTRWIQQLRNR